MEAEAGPGLQQVGGDPERLPAHGVERGVDAVRGQRPEPVGEAVAVGHRLRTELPDVVVVALARGADDAGARVAGELDGERARHAAAAWTRTVSPSWIRRVRCST